MYGPKRDPFKGARDKNEAFSKRLLEDRKRAP